MIVKVDQTNIMEAASVHSVSWQESHSSFCTPEFIALHTPEHQRIYLQNKIDNGSTVYMFVEKEPIGIVSVIGNLIEDLYVLPSHQNQGHGTQLLQFAMNHCDGIPTLWILENNMKAEKLYRKMGFKETGRVNAVASGLDEIEFALA
ncbi:MAG: GNAT family N-acetyltransferase [Coriobacteriales bacterium]|nr:GNAT family N-acetyltransferase [Coriobacteriales bacterium]